jgi:hypothetical protein
MNPTIAFPLSLGVAAGVGSPAFRRCRSASRLVKPELQQCASSRLEGTPLGVQAISRGLSPHAADDTPGSPTQNRPHPGGVPASCIRMASFISKSEADFPLQNSAITMRSVSTVAATPPGSKFTPHKLSGGIASLNPRLMATTPRRGRSALPPEPNCRTPSARLHALQRRLPGLPVGPAPVTRHAGATPGTMEDAHD